LGVRVGEKELEYVVETFNINSEHIEEVVTKEDLTIYQVNLYPSSSCEVYMVDSQEAIMLACKPYIVGEEFLELNRRLSMKIIDVIEAIIPLREWKDRIVFQHVLRAAPGYTFHKAITGSGYNISEVYIRPKYVQPSFRDHLESRRLEVVYKDFDQLPKGENLLLIKPDTEATGRTSVISLRELVKACKSVDTEIEELVLYGFMTSTALNRIFKESSRLGIKKVYAIALVDIAALAYNEYDMVLYGIDESYYIAGSGTRLLGAIVHENTLRRCLPYYVPGMDQPGDWSARQDLLLTGSEYELGDIENHLRNSIEIARKLLEIQSREGILRDWQRKIIIECIEILRQRLSHYTKSTT